MILKYRKTVTIPLYSTCSCLEVITLNSSHYLSSKIIYHIMNFVPILLLRLHFACDNKNVKTQQNSIDRIILTSVAFEWAATQIYGHQPLKLVCCDILLQKKTNKQQHDYMSQAFWFLKIIQAILTLGTKTPAILQVSFEVQPWAILHEKC